MAPHATWIPSLIPRSPPTKQNHTRKESCLRAQDRAHICTLPGHLTPYRHVLRQVHSDYAKGIAAARRPCFPNARPCEDVAHMMRAARSSLQGMLRVSRLRTATDARGRKINIKVHLEEILAMLRTTRFIATMELFGAIWQVFLGMMRRLG